MFEPDTDSQEDVEDLHVQSCWQVELSEWEVVCIDLKGIPKRLSFSKFHSYDEMYKNIQISKLKQNINKMLKTFHFNKHHLKKGPSHSRTGTRTKLFLCIINMRSGHNPIKDMDRFTSWYTVSNNTIVCFQWILEKTGTKQGYQYEKCQATNNTVYTLTMLNMYISTTTGQTAVKQQWVNK